MSEHSGDTKGVRFKRRDLLASAALAYAGRSGDDDFDQAW